MSLTIQSSYRRGGLIFKELGMSGRIGSGVERWNRGGNVMIMVLGTGRLLCLTEVDGIRILHCSGFRLTHHGLGMACADISACRRSSIWMISVGIMISVSIMTSVGISHSTLRSQSMCTLFITTATYIPFFYLVIYADLT